MARQEIKCLSGRQMMVRSETFPRLKIYRLRNVIGAIHEAASRYEY